MKVIKNTIKVVKDNPKSFLSVGNGLTDIASDVRRLKKGGSPFTLIPFALSSLLTITKNFNDIIDEIKDADKIMISIDPEDEIVQDILTEWTADDSKDINALDYRAMTIGTETGLSVVMVPTSNENQKLNLSNGNYALLSINEVPVLKNGKESGRHTISFSVYLDNHEDYEVFSKMLNTRLEEYTEPKDRPLRLYTNSMYSFSKRELPKREYESVILKEGQSEYITEFLESFFDNKDVYEKKGFVHRTGILFYGPPGTGKTSIATAIANKYRKNVYQIQLSAISGGDEELVSLFSDIPADSIVLLEDIDVATDKGKNREESSNDSSGITLGALLNVIDGNFAPNDAVFIMTTNDKDSLDPALTRPGRADLHIHVDYLDDGQLSRMCHYYLGFVPEGLPKNIDTYRIEPSKVVSIFREHVLDTKVAGDKLVEELRKREPIV